MTALALGENAFWEGAFRASATGWEAVRREAQPNTTDAMADLRLRVYLVDTHANAIHAMLTHVRVLHHAHQRLTRSGEARAAAAHAGVGKILHLNDPEASADPARQREAFDAGLMLLAGSATYTRIIDSNSEGLAGHWMLILYRLNDGAHLTRPMFWTTPDDAQPLLTPMELHLQVSTAVRFDHDARETGIGRRIAQGGGLDLHPRYA